MASRIFRRLNVKQIALGAVALATVMMIPKVGDVVSGSIGKVRSKLSGSSI